MGLFFVSLVFGKLAKTRLRTGPDRFQTVSEEEEEEEAFILCKINKAE